MRLALDIDQTLSLTRFEYYKQLYDYYGYPGSLTLAQVVAMHRYSSISHVKFWFEKPDFQDVYQKIENGGIVHNEARLIDGALEYVNKMLEEGVEIVAYITARYSNIAEDTQKWLDRAGFPKAELVTRDRSYTNEGKWKARVLFDRYPSIKAIVDDNPALVDELDKIGYKGKIFLFQSVYTKRIKVDVIECEDWEDVYNKIKKDIR